MASSGPGEIPAAWGEVGDQGVLEPQRSLPCDPQTDPREDGPQGPQLPQRPGHAKPLVLKELRPQDPCAAQRIGGEGPRGCLALNASERLHGRLHLPPDQQRRDQGVSTPSPHSPAQHDKGGAGEGSSPRRVTPTTSSVCHCQATQGSPPCPQLLPLTYPSGRGQPLLGSLLGHRFTGTVEAAVDWTVPPRHECAEALTPDVAVSGDRAFREGST